MKTKERFQDVVHQCNKCGNTWIPRGWAVTYCPKCGVFNITVIIGGKMASDIAAYSTSGKPRFVCVGDSMVEFKSSHDEPMIDVKLLPKINLACDQLASINRFNGATTIPYSVAQHSVIVGDIVAKCIDPKLELPALLHDLPEIVYGDITTGVKNAMGMVLTKFLEEIDHLVMNHYLSRFGFKYPLPAAQAEAIKRADEFALHYEAETLLSKNCRPSARPDVFGSSPVVACDLSEYDECWGKKRASDELLKRVMAAAKRCSK